MYGFKYCNSNFFKTEQNMFKNSFFFPSAVIELDILEYKTRNVESFSVFKNNIHGFIKPIPKSVHCTKNEVFH